MPRADDDAPDYIDDVHRDIFEFSDRHPDLWDDDEEQIAEFREWAMERKGFKRNTVTTWAPPDPPSGSGAGGSRSGMPRGGQRQGRQGQGGKGASYFGGKSSR